MLLSLKQKMYDTLIFYSILHVLYSVLFKVSSTLKTFLTKMSSIRVFCDSGLLRQEHKKEKNNNPISFLNQY